MQAHSHPLYLDDDADDDATVVSPSPFLMVPVRGTYTEPLRGYPAGAAFVPRRLDQSVIPGTMVQDLVPNRPDNRTAPLGFAAYQTGGDPAPVAAPYLGTAATAGRQRDPDSGVRPVPAAMPTPEALPPTRAVPAIQAPPVTAATPTPTPRLGRAFVAAGAGAVLGALLWGGIGFATGGSEFKYAAVAIGAVTGLAAARFGGGHGKAVGVLGATFGLASILMGKGLFELLVQPELTLTQHIAYHTTLIDLVFYAATIVTGFAVGAGVRRPRLRIRPAVGPQSP